MKNNKLRSTMFARPILVLSCTVSLLGLMGSHLGAAMRLQNPPQTGPLKWVADIELPGKAARLDYQAFDERTNRLYITHLGDDKLIVVDGKRRKVVTTIRNVSKPHGVIVVRAENRLFTSSTGSKEIVAIGLDSLNIVGRCPAGQYPDGLTYEPQNHSIFVTDEHGSQDVIVDAQAVRNLGSIPLGGNHVGNTRYDHRTGLVWVAVGDTNQLVAIDPAKRNIVKRIQLPGTEGAHGVEFNEDSSLAFVGCEDNNKLAVVDVEAGRLIQTFSVAPTPDVLAFDQKLKRLYVSCEDGALSIFKEVGGKLALVANQVIGPNAHSVCIDPKTHDVFFPLMNVGGKPVLRIMKPALHS